MSTAITKWKRMVLAVGAGAAMMVAASTAPAAQCQSTFDEDGEAVVMCGSVAYYAGESDTEEDEVDEDGSAFVDVEDCEPGKYWMMEFDDDDDYDTPMAC
jgi:hypothetical protein